jgi:XTP/dITP diphosphohydrolase
VYVRHPNDPQPIIAEGIWHGEIVDQPAGENGFGYDPYMWLPEQGCTVAQLAPEVKNSISHRAQALRSLLSRLKEV